MKEKEISSPIDVLMLFPGVGFILLFIGSSIFMTLVQSFGLFSITGKSVFTLENWKVILQTRESMDSLFFSLKMGLLSSIGTLVVPFPLALFSKKGGPGRESWVLSSKCRSLY